MRIKRSILSTTVMIISQNVLASPYYNNINRHYYDFVDFYDVGYRLDWTQARDYASNLELLGVSGYTNGYLATVTSQFEDNFLWGLRDSNDGILASGRFIGAYDTSSIDSEGNLQHNEWKWVTGESFVYTNWNDGEPNNALNKPEDYLMYWWEAGASSGRWNDTTLTSCVEDFCSSWGFIVEYAPAPVPTPSALWLFISGLGFIRSIKRG